jgi:exodeoxyribonuclease V
MEALGQPKLNLTDHQKWALYQLVTGIRDKKLTEQTLGGFAGTGKTTIIKYLVKFFPNYAVAAYTGKAANVLRKKGIAASTIHSRIYKPAFDNDGMFFDLAPDPGCDGFIIDEASMVSQDIYEDLKAYGLPMVFVGDHGQLEPIDSKLNLMETPDYTLEEIHRNAGDIAKFAEHLRKGLSSRGFRGSDGSVQFLPGKALDTDVLTSVDQVICAFNKTRVAMNAQIRSGLGFEGLLNVGERVMCLRNDRKYGLFNGMQGIVRNIFKKKTKNYMDFEFDGVLLEGICYDPSNFGQESYKIKHGQDTPNPFDYGYCITAHKSQGDEWNNVLVIEQQCKNWSHKRWAYTAASRAKNSLKWKFG